MLLLLLATEDFLLVTLESLSSCGLYLHESMSSFSTRNLVFYLGQVISSYLFSLLLMLLLLSLCLAIPVLGDFDLIVPVPLAIQLLYYDVFHPPKLASRTVPFPQLLVVYQPQFVFS